jgi:hypothetical protein
MIVRAARRMSRAISLGVFCRLAPSTIAIIRSRKVSPGWVVIRTISQSESTRVPPVTLERSPRLSRITGALSPVMALSSTEATPSRTSPSEGMTSPASTSTTSPLRRFEALMDSAFASRRGVPRRLAGTSLRVFLRASAWALPRPSAIASAKLAKSRVNQSQAAIARPKPPSLARSRSPMMVAATLPTRTVNITGLRICRRGSSFRTESQRARRTIGGSNSGRALFIDVVLTSPSSASVPRSAPAPGPG